MTAVGTCKEHARQLADVIVEADRRGHYSHGLNRLGTFDFAGVAHVQVRAVSNRQLVK